MPLHDFRCPNCGTVKVDVYLPISLRASQAVIPCTRCRPAAMGQDGADHTGKFFSVMVWIPQIARMDCSSGPSFKAFTTQQRQPDGSYKEITLSSVNDLRRVERESEAAARNGEGEAMRFRMWSQDASQGDQNSFGDDPSIQARKDLAAMQLEAGGRRRARLSTIRGDAARRNAEQLGPGVTEASASVPAVD